MKQRRAPKGWNTLKDFRCEQCGAKPIARVGAKSTDDDWARPTCSCVPARAAGVIRQTRRKSQGTIEGATS